jgi:hypothetical protein
VLGKGMYHGWIGGEDILSKLVKID